MRPPSAEAAIVERHGTEREAGWRNDAGSIRVTSPDFDIDDFLAAPLTARLATNGPTVRPVWFLWEDSVFWILTGPWAQLARRVREDPELAITVDVCDLETGLTRQVVAAGVARVVPFDVARGRRLLGRYLGEDEARWDPRFRVYLHDDPAATGAAWLRIEPRAVHATDLSFHGSTKAD